MTTLNSITEDIAYSLGEQFNDTLRQSIKNSIIEYRALVIRQDLEKGFMSPQHYLQSFCVQMVTTDASECDAMTTGKIILESKEVLPKTVRIKGKGFTFVGSVDRFITHVHSSKQNLANREALPFQKEGQIYYSIINNKLILLNNNRPCKVLLEGVIEDPRDIEDCNYPDRFVDDIPFACPADLLVGIKNAIKKEYFPKLIEDGKEINMDTDGND